MAKTTDGQSASPARGVHAASTSPALRTVKRATAHEIAARIQERQRQRDANYGDDPPTYGNDQAAALIERLMQARPNREQQ